MLTTSTSVKVFTAPLTPTKELTRSTLMAAVCATAVVFYSLSYAPLALADQTADKDYQIDVTATFTSDYLFRGVSQTLEDPAVQASIDVSHNSGLFAGIWSSNVDFQDRGPADDQADQEIDLYLGYGTELNSDWSVDATFIRYIFPGTAGDSDLDWNELLFGAHFRDTVSLLIAYSNDVFNLDETGIYYGVSGNLPITDRFSLTASAGYYDLDDVYQNNEDGYKDWSIGAEMSMGMFTGSLAYVDTDGSGEDLFGDNADSRIVLTISASFGQ